jgi:hypothetical protein
LALCTPGDCSRLRWTLPLQAAQVIPETGMVQLRVTLSNVTPRSSGSRLQ